MTSLQDMLQGGRQQYMTGRIMAVRELPSHQDIWVRLFTLTHSHWKSFLNPLLTFVKQCWFHYAKHIGKSMVNYKTELRLAPQFHQFQCGIFGFLLLFYSKMQSKKVYIAKLAVKIRVDRNFSSPPFSCVMAILCQLHFYVVLTHCARHLVVPFDIYMLHQGRCFTFHVINFESWVTKPSRQSFMKVNGKTISRGQPRFDWSSPCHNGSRLILAELAFDPSIIWRTCSVTLTSS